MTTRIDILLTLLFLSFFSCQDKKTDTENLTERIIIKDSNNYILTKKANAEIDSWQVLNDELENKYGSRVEFNDIKSAYRQLLKANLFDSSILIDESFYPTFTHLSPSAMLEQVILESKHSNRAKEMKVFTSEDVDFILSQDKLRSTNAFKWSTITNKIKKDTTFPKIEIGIPVFSIDKRKFIVGIREYKSEGCVTLVSYLFINGEKQSNYYIFEKVTSC